MSIDLSNIEASLIEDFSRNCTQSVIGSEYTFHQLAPYIGKVKSSIAAYLVNNFTSVGDTILDPFCGAGTIPFEAWCLGRNVIANDLNAYANVLTLAKLFPPSSEAEIHIQIGEYSELVSEKVKDLSLENVPTWVRDFFHPETLKEILAWVDVLKEDKQWFLLSCLLGILHHQRPGFLSYPSSHTVPYLRIEKFPKLSYPELYEYRSVPDRLLKKAKRAFKRTPSLNYDLTRIVSSIDARDLSFGLKVDAIITSPPYMRQLDYARDNRLRLWFLGVTDWRKLEPLVSPAEDVFVEMIQTCINKWDYSLKQGGRCVLFLGDNYSKKFKLTLPEMMDSFFYNSIGSYELEFKHQSIIPDNRRVRREGKGNKSEILLVYRKK